MNAPHMDSLDQMDLKYYENLRSFQNRSGMSQNGSRDEILIKCKQTIENLHYEIQKQKQVNFELDS